MMEQNFDIAFENVRRLVSDFQKHEKAYLAPSYSESDVRKDFIDKFWIALGWDVNHEQQKNPYEQEVKVERSVDVKGRKKKADYAFLAPNFRDVRFFVEAKKPSRNIDNADDYFQTIRYGWNAQTPLSVLTDFEQFHVLDCRYKPDVQVALQRAIKKIHYTEYADEEKFREIYFLFSREAVTNGALEKFAEALPKPTGKAAQRKLYGGTYKSVDDDFLQELDELREELARSFKNRNPQLNGEELTEATQRTLDRLVFMRFLEDKLIEPEAIVERLGERSTAWADFVAESKRLDRIYNGIIFKHHSIIDDVGFIVDERVFASVRERLAHTNSPYDFNVIPIHILGSIYERFLGKVIVATDKRARIEEKPEVRKAGGVYYTPEHIVTYIVENTIGKLVEGKTPEQISQMRFADIACGSGSFLLGIYDFLLRYHTAYYNEKKNRAKGLRAGSLEHADGTLHLSLRQKKDILLNNVYGVDLDAQAVEVAQLSLFLKLLEEETTATAKNHQLEFRETMLPSLDKNIVHGNSLIGWDILDGQLFDSEEERKLYPLDFTQAFSEVMRRGGFDAIIGNPPYIGFHGFKREKEYLKETYLSAKGKFDFYLPFVEKGIALLKSNGILSFICPTNFMKRGHGESLRTYLKQSVKIREVCDFQDVQIFTGALNYTGVFVFEKALPPSDYEILYKCRSLNDIGFHVSQASLDNNAWIFREATTSKFIEKVKNQEQVLPLGQLTSGIAEGIVTGHNDVFLLPVDTAKELELEEDLIRVCLRGRQVRRYWVDQVSEVVIYPYRLVNGRTKVISEKELQSYSNVFSYLTKRRKDLKGRSYFDASSKAWFELWCQRDLELLTSRKIIVPELSDSNRFAIATEKQFYGDTVCGITFLPSIEEDLEYFLGILNSKLLESYYKQTTVPKANQFYIYKTMFLKNLPIRTINFSDKADKARHDKMVNLVEQMLQAKQQLAAARTDRDRTYYENKCAALDRQIDALVYELYKLTPEEIAIIEAS